MKTTLTSRMILLLFSFTILTSCGNRYKGSAADTTGTNGATNGTGKIPKSEAVHNYQTQ